MLIIWYMSIFSHQREIVWGRNTDFQKLFSVTEQINLKPLLAHYSLKIISKGGITVVIYIDDNTLKTTLSLYGRKEYNELIYARRFIKEKKNKNVEIRKNMFWENI